MTATRTVEQELATQFASLTEELTSTSIRELTDDELSLVCGGADSVRIVVS